MIARLSEAAAVEVVIQIPSEPQSPKASKAKSSCCGAAFVGCGACEALHVLVEWTCALRTRRSERFLLLSIGALGSGWLVPGVPDVFWPPRPLVSFRIGCKCFLVRLQGTSVWAGLASSVHCPGEFLLGSGCCVGGCGLELVCR